MDSVKRHSIAVVVPVRNEERSIAALLDALARQTRPADEIIICDGGSTDATVPIIEAYAPRLPMLRLLRAGAALPGRARNVGISAAASELVALTDAGTCPAPTWLERVAASFEQDGAPDVVYGGFEPATESFLQRCIGVAFVPPRDRSGVRGPSVASMAMRRTVWQAVEGFREDLRSAEDLLFIRSVAAKNFSIRCAPEALVSWQPPSTLGAAFQRFSAYSESNIRAGLAREWQYPLLRIYVFTAALALAAYGTAFAWVPPLAIFCARATRRVMRESGIRAAANLPLIAGVAVALLTIDMATFNGVRRWWLSRFQGRPQTRMEHCRAAHDAHRAHILYLCYLGIAEPLVETQVLPYLSGLARAGHRVTLLTFEPRRVSPQEREGHRAAVLARSVEWDSLRYHKRPALPATLLDIAAGVARAIRVAARSGPTIVHARGHVPAVIAAVVKRLRGTPMIFDIRGLMADEYVDAGLWRRGGLLYRSIKRVEAWLLHRADAMVVLTWRARAWLAAQRPDQNVPVEVIPCCVDGPRFRVDAARTSVLRASLGFADGPVLVYAGKFGGWYMAGETVDFFCAAKRVFPRLRFLVLTQSGSADIETAFKQRGIEGDAYRRLAVPPNELPAYLSLATFAVSFIRPRFSKMAASPTKMAEYLAAGVPVVYNAGVGDLDELEDEGVGARIAAFSEAEYDAALRTVLRLIEDREGTARRCRAAAERRFSLQAVGIPAYVRLYARLAERLAGGSSADAAASVRLVGAREPRGIRTAGASGVRRC